MITTIINWLIQSRHNLVELWLDNLNINDITQLLKVEDLFYIYDAITTNLFSSKNLGYILFDWIKGIKKPEFLKKYMVTTKMSTAELEKLIEDTIKENMNSFNLNLEKRRKRVEKMLMGQIMKQIKGAFKPQEVMEIITKHLKNC